MEEFARRVSVKRVKINTTHTLNVTPSIYRQVEKEKLRKIEWPERIRPFTKGDRVIIQQKNQYHRSNRGQIVGQVKEYTDGLLYFSVQSVSELIHSR